MKKISIILAFIICILSLKINVQAVDEAVTIESAAATASSVSVSGTTNATAVMVQVRDASGTNIISMQSFGVAIDHKFNGTIPGLPLTPGTEYKIYIADYEGGDWATASVVASSAPEPAPGPASSPSSTAPAVNPTTPNVVDDPTLIPVPVDPDSNNDDTIQSPKCGEESNSSHAFALIILVYTSLALIYLRKKHN